MLIPNAHHFDCHPDEQDYPMVTSGYVPQDIEQCSHCGTSVRRGCWCSSCTTPPQFGDNQRLYHCPRCNRIWDYLYQPVIVAIRVRDREGRRTSIAVGGLPLPTLDAE